MKIFLAFTLIVTFFFPRLVSSEELTGQTYWEGLKSSVTYFYVGSYKQFVEPNNLYYAAAAVPALWFSFEEDKRISHHSRTKGIPKSLQITSDLAPVISFPLIPIAFFTYGVKKDDGRAVQFSKEFFATMYIALIESALLSAVDIHERPDNDVSKLSKWETNFRQNSSFPSGHVVPYAALTLKTLQFYGPWYSLVPATLFTMTSIQRIRDGKHYLSDVVGGFFLTAFASEGVRRAGGYADNHPVYKALFENNLKIGYIEHQGVLGPRISMDW